MNGTQTRAFTSHLHKHASEYYVEFGSAEVYVNLLSERRHRYSTFYRFELNADGDHRFVLVKVPSSKNGTGDQHDGKGQRLGERPRIAPVIDAETRFRLQYEALATIHDYFSGLDDPRFGTVRVLDLLADQYAIVMEEVQDPSLRRLFLEVNRLHIPFSTIDLDRPFRNVGAWLRAYHALPKRHGVEARLARRADFVELLVKVTDFLSNALGDGSFFQNVAATTAANALEALPDSLPLGLGHGDYALRNILVGPNNRVTILDTLARWQAPIYEDIAHFLVGLKMNRLQAVTQGLAFSPQRLAHYEEEFLTGYFDQESIPFQAIRLYEILVLLNRWSSQVSRADQNITGSRFITNKLQLALTGRFFRKSVVNLLRATSRV